MRLLYSVLAASLFAASSLSQVTIGIEPAGSNRFTLFLPANSGSFFLLEESLFVHGPYRPSAAVLPDAPSQRTLLPAGECAFFRLRVFPRGFPLDLDGDGQSDLADLLDFNHNPIDFTKGVWRSVANHVGDTAQTVTSDFGSATTLTTHDIAFGPSSLRLAYAGVKANPRMPPSLLPFDNLFEVSASVQFADGPIQPVHFRGSRLGLVNPGQLLISDAVQINPKAGDVLQVRTYVNRIASGPEDSFPGLLWKTQEFLPLNSGIFGALHQTADSFSSSPNGGHDLTDGGPMHPVNARGFGPVAILAEVPAPSSPRAVAIIGDSIAGGAADFIHASPRNHMGFIARAFGSQHGMLRLSRGGEQAAWWIDIPELNTFRSQLFGYASDAVIHLGGNDIAAGKPLEKIKADLLQIWRGLRDNGIRPRACTLIPRSRSLDGWTSLDGQQVAAGEEIRVAINEWIRGKPEPLAGFFDVADAVESHRNSGRWAPGPAHVHGEITEWRDGRLFDASKQWKENEHRGRVVFNLTRTAGVVIVSNSTNSLLLNGPFVGFDQAAHGGAPGDLYMITDALTIDGIHPSASGHSAMATHLALVGLNP